MPPLPRGICPVCENEVALRKGGLVREHRVNGRVCSGAGEMAADYDQSNNEEES